MANRPKKHEQTLFGNLLQSGLLATYQDAFRCATGLPLRLVSAGMEDWCLGDNPENRGPFCERLNLCKSACNACIDTNRRLMTEAAVHGPTTCHCFAGMAATAVPVRAGKEIVAYLKTGQVFYSVPEPARFEVVAGTLERQGVGEEEIRHLREAYFQTRTIEPGRYQSMVTLLATFAEQLGRHAEMLVLMRDGAEHAAIGRARDFISNNLASPLPLALVAGKAGLSESHFCRVFHDATGMTLTDYVNRMRVEWAKRELMKPDMRVTEIAFLVGYQSLSQFNRSFVRITGKSPTALRAEALASASLASAWG